MNTFLIGFTYHEPERWMLFQKGIIEDCESSTGIYVEASTVGEAITWAACIAEELLRASNSDPTLDWKSLGYECWVVEEPSNSNWSHCLGFFQSVEIGVFPDLVKMGAIAYGMWTKDHGISYG